MKKTIAISIIVSNMLFGASTVTNMETNFKNTINGTSTIDNSTVNQGKTSITESTVTGVDLKNAGTGNTISGTAISNESEVDQATFIINKSSAITNEATAENDVRDIKVTSTNDIKNTKIDGSKVKQNYINIEGKDGAVTVSKLNITQTNTIDNTDTTNDIDTKASTLSQGEFTFSNGATITDITQNDTDNRMSGNKVSDATMSQNSITADNATVNAFENIDGGEAETNLIENSTLSGTENKAVADASIVQNRATFTNGASVANSKTTQKNIVTGSSITKTHVVQGDTSVNGAKVRDFDTKFTNTISEATISTTTGDSKTIEQGVLNIGGTGTKVSDIAWGDTDDGAVADADTNNVDITATNMLQQSTLEDSSLVQSKTTINTGAVVSGLNVEQTNTIQRLDAESDANDDTNPNNKATRATISQGDTLIQGGTVTTMEQFLDNNIKSSTLTDAVLSQGDSDISSSDVTNLTMGTTGTHNTNSVEGTTITGTSSTEKSSLSQGYTKIDNSTVDNLTINQTNLVKDSDITGGSTVTQGSTIIDGSTSSDG